MCFRQDVGQHKSACVACLLESAGVANSACITAMPVVDDGISLLMAQNARPQQLLMLQSICKKELVAD